MRLLLDTNAFLKWVDADRGLSRKARDTLADPGNECLVSIASAWEIAIKCGLGKLRLAVPAARYVANNVVANGFILLAIDIRHIARIETLTNHHRDPFDRLLIAQALVEDIPVVTADQIFRKYGVKRIW